MGFLLIFILYIVWRVFDFLILFLAPKFIPYLGFFPYKEILPLYHLPDWITKLANFDGTHYLLISQQGYMTYEQAYFPLYPLLIKLLTFVTNNSFISGFLISNVFFILGLWMFYKYLLQTNQQKSDNSHLTPNPYLLTIIFLLVFPTSFFFGAIYTEGLFFFLFVGSLYFLKKKNYVLAGIFAFLASLTRLIGVFLIIPIFVNLLRQFSVFNFQFSIKSKFSFIKFLKFIENFKFQISNLLAPLLGLFTYMLYLRITVKDPLYFLSSQPIFGAHRSTNLISLPQVYWRYFKILFTANHDFQFYVSMSEMIIFTIVFIVLIFDLLKNIRVINSKSQAPKTKQIRNSNINIQNRFENWKFDNLNLFGNWKLVIGNSNRLALSLFSLTNLLVPTLTGTFSSIPRYALFSISFFIFLGSIKNNLLKISIAILFAICHIVMLAYFGQGYFVS
jgi:hypothetical protein